MILLDDNSDTNLPIKVGVLLGQPHFGSLLLLEDEYLLHLHGAYRMD